MPTKKIFRPTKYTRETFLDLQNTHLKNTWTHEIPMRGTFAPTKYSQAKISDQQRHNGTMVQEPQNLARSYKCE